MGMKIRLNEAQLKMIMNEGDVERPCTKFDYGSMEFKFCKMISSKEWVRMTRPLVEKVLDHKRKKWVEVSSSEKQQSVSDVLDIIEEVKPKLRNTVQKVREKLDTLGFIYDEDGQWDYINKLNTNFADTATFMTDLVIHYSDTNIKDVYEGVMSGEKQMVQELVDQAMDAPERVYDDLINDPTDKFKYSRMSMYYTAKGDVVEDMVEDLMNTNGWETVHKGGNGDPIDMLLGIDLIVVKDGVYQFVQSKKVFDIKKFKSKDVNGMIYIINGNVFSVREEIVDLMGYATEGGRVIVVGKQRLLKNTTNGIERTSKYNFPIPTRNSESLVHYPFKKLVNF